MTARPPFTQLQPAPWADEPAGKPFAHQQYRVRCGIPHTREGVVFDELGVCQACQACQMACCTKRGYGRATFHAGVDVRAGLLSRDAAWQLIRDNDGVGPEGLDDHLRITGMSEDEFFTTLEKHRRPEWKTTVIPIDPKAAKNEEELLPVPQQLQRRFGTLKV